MTRFICPLKKIGEHDCPTCPHEGREGDNINGAWCYHCKKLLAEAYWETMIDNILRQSLRSYRDVDDWSMNYLRDFQKMQKGIKSFYAVELARAKKEAKEEVRGESIELGKGNSFSYVLLGDIQDKAVNEDRRCLRQKIEKRIQEETEAFGGSRRTALECFDFNWLFSLLEDKQNPSTQ